MNRFSHSWADFVIKRRVVILGLTLALLALAPLSFNRLYYDNSNETYFLKNDPHLAAYDRLLDRFGDSEYLVIGVPARKGDKDIFNADTIRAIDELTTFLEDNAVVTQVRSISKYQYTHDDRGTMATDDLFPDRENPSQSELNSARQIVEGEDLALGTLVTPDFHDARIIARTQYIKNDSAHYVKLVNELQDFIHKKNFAARGFDLKLSGIPVVNERFQTLTKRDQAWLNPLMGAVILGLLFFIFRSLFATLTPLVVILATMLLVTALQGLMHWPFTAVTSGLIPTMIILSIGTSVHVLVEFFQLRRHGLAPLEAARATTNELLSAIFFTSLTTSIGFITLSITRLSPVQQFALLAAFGPMAIFLIATTTLPALLSYVPWVPRNHRKLKPGELPDTPVQRIVERVPDFTYRHRKFLGLLGIVLTAFSLYGIRYIKADSNVLNYFHKNSWVNQDLIYFNDKFRGIINLEVVVDSGEDGGVKNPHFLQRVDAMQNWLESFNETGNAVSIVDFLKKINQALHNDDKSFYTLPTSREMAAQFLLLYENTGPNEDLSDLKDFDERYLRISLPVINMDETETSKFLKSIRKGMKKNFADLPVELTGSLVMNNAQNAYINHGMLQSFSIAILVIGLCFLLLFRSLKYGLIALIPSIVPILLAGSLISLAGIPMDLGTMIVGSMTIGIAVDDSIHLMSRFLAGRRKGLDAKVALHEAIHSSGRAVILSSVILVTGFSVLLLGSFIPIVYVGLFSAIIMSFALAGDLLFMPALIYLIDKPDPSSSVSPTYSTNEGDPVDVK